MRGPLSCISVVAVVLALGTSASGGPPGSWTKVTDAGANNDELGLVRSPNGQLHVAWAKVVTPAKNTEIWHTGIAPTGSVGGRSLISSKWNAAGGPKLVATPAGLRVFFAGLCCSIEAGGIQSATAGHDGAKWKAEPGHVSTDVNAAGTVGAALLPDGTPIFSWSSGSKLLVHTGIDPKVGEQDLGASPQCCLGWPELATDQATKVTTLAYASLVRDKGGLYVRTVKPAVGAPKLVPKSLTGKNFVLPDLRLPLVARDGGGVYLAYCGGYPTCKQVLLWRVGRGAPMTVSAGAAKIEDVNASRGPDGRIWVTWWSRDEGRVFATRSNKKASSFGAVVSAPLPAGERHVWKLFAEGSAGPLDVLASAGSPAVFWHTQLLPRLSVKCIRTDKDTVTCTVTDVGDPVPDATVRLTGQTGKTGANGQVVFKDADPSLAATATKSGYAAA
jgi:hypothetical protein